MPESYGPSPAAVAAAARAMRPFDGDDIAEDWVQDTRDVLAAAHDPALGLDRSVCLRDVIDVLRREGVVTDEGGSSWDVIYPGAADAVLRRFDAS